jgi:hypothetical protein
LWLERNKDFHLHISHIALNFFGEGESRLTPMDTSGRLISSADFAGNCIYISEHLVNLKSVRIFAYVPITFVRQLNLDNKAREPFWASATRKLQVSQTFTLHLIYSFGTRRAQRLAETLAMIWGRHMVEAKLEAMMMPDTLRKGTSQEMTTEESYMAGRL